jgi:predicted acetyltransferase
MADMEQETVKESDGAINNIVYITENPFEKEKWMNLKSDHDSLKVQLIQQRTSSPRVSDGDQMEVQNLVKLLERLKYEKQERQVVCLELQEAQNTNRRLKAEYSAIQNRYQNCQQDLQIEKQDVDKLKKEVDTLTKENLKFQNDVRQFEKTQSQFMEQFDSIKLENRALQAKLASLIESNVTSETCRKVQIRRGRQKRNDQE